MKRLLMLLVLGLTLGAQSLHAGEKGDKMPSFWERLRAKIESLTPQKKSTVTTATGGIRGAPVASEDIYWKDEATAESIAADELEAFTRAMKLSEDEDKAQAQTAFAEFIKKYPDSALRKDADQALTMLQNPSASAR